LPFYFYLFLFLFKFLTIFISIYLSLFGTSIYNYDRNNEIRKTYTNLNFGLNRAFKNFTKTLIYVGLRFNSRQHSDYVISHIKYVRHIKILLVYLCIHTYTFFYVQCFLSQYNLCTFFSFV